MSKQYNIKWRVEDEKELRRVARNFNDKLRRLTKKTPENKNILPQFYNKQTQQFESRITLATLKESIQTRQDYNRMVNMLKRFTIRGAERIIEAPDNEYGTRTTVWQRQETARLASIVNRKRKERLNTLGLVEVLSAEGPMGYTLGQMFGMGLATKNQLQPARAFTRSQSQTDLKYKMRALIEESRSNFYLDKDQQLKENYINTLKQNYAEEDIKDIITKINKMDNDLFILKFEAKSDAFEYAYPPERGSEEYKAYLEEMRGYWMKDTALTDLSSAFTATMVNL